MAAFSNLTAINLPDTWYGLLYANYAGLNATNGGTCNFAITNTNAYPVAVSLVTAEGPETYQEAALEWNTVIPPNGVLERTGFVFEYSTIVYCTATSAGVSVRAYGYTA